MYEERGSGEEKEGGSGLRRKIAFSLIFEAPWYLGLLSLCAFGCGVSASNRPRLHFTWAMSHFPGPGPASRFVHSVSDPLSFRNGL